MAQKYLHHSAFPFYLLITGLGFVVFIGVSLLHFDLAPFLLIGLTIVLSLISGWLLQRCYKLESRLANHLQEKDQLEKQLVHEKQKNISSDHQLCQYQQRIHDFNQWAIQNQAEFEQRVSSLQQELEALRERLNSDQQHHNQAIENFNQDLTQLQEQLRFEQEVSQEYENEITELERQLKEHQDELQAEAGQGTESSNLVELATYQERVQVLERDLRKSEEKLQQLLPQNVEFLKNSLSLIWDKFDSPVAVLSQIWSISEGVIKEGSQKVNGTNREWFEQRVEKNERHWRLYFRFCSQSAMYQVYMSRKTKQKQDINWLNQQTCC